MRVMLDSLISVGGGASAEESDGGEPGRTLAETDDSVAASPRPCLFFLAYPAGIT